LRLIVSDSERYMKLREAIRKDINPASYATFRPEFLEDRLVRLFKQWALEKVKKCLVISSKVKSENEARELVVGNVESLIKELQSQ
jgi:hypothetical protein